MTSCAFDRRTGQKIACMAAPTILVRGCGEDRATSGRHRLMTVANSRLVQAKDRAGIVGADLVRHGLARIHRSDGHWR